MLYTILSQHVLSILFLESSLLLFEQIILIRRNYTFFIFFIIPIYFTKNYEDELIQKLGHPYLLYELIIILTFNYFFLLLNYFINCFQKYDQFLFKIIKLKDLTFLLNFSFKV